MKTGSTGSSTTCRSGREELLVLAPNWLGDAVMATPFLLVLREWFPGALITVVSRDYAAELFRRNAAIDFVVAYRGGVRACIAAARKHMSTKGYNACFVLPPSFAAALVSRACRARRRIGYGGQWRSILLTDALPERGMRAEHLSKAYLRLLERFAGRLVPAVPLPVVVPGEGWKEAADAAGGHAAYFVLAPGATYGSSKVWPYARFAELARRLVERTNWTAVCVGREEEREPASALLGTVGNAGRNLAGRLSVSELVSVLRGARITIGNDSGPVHIAAALGVPTVAVFGPTSVDWTAPRGTAVRIVKGDIECAPCFKRRCPYGAAECLMRVDVARVHTAAVSLIEEVRRETA